MAPKSKRAAKATDPIFAAIAERQKLEKIWSVLYHKLDVAEGRADKKHGRRPWGLIKWRKYGAIGGSEIDKAREAFLEEGFKPKMINTEYRDAKARERAAQRAQKAWDRRVGIAAQRRECDRAMEAESRASVRMAKTRPTTPAGAAAMLEYVKAGMKDGEIDWHDIALATLVTTLRAWGKAAGGHTKRQSD
jgi:hypothetical protein